MILNKVLSFLFIPTNVKSIIFDYLTIYKDPTELGSVEIKRELKKRKTSIKRNRVFHIAMK